MQLREFESAFPRRLITSRDNMPDPLRRRRGCRRKRPVQTPRKRSNFQLLNCESTSDRFQSASQKTTYITAEKRSRAAKAGSLFARWRQRKRLFLFFFSDRAVANLQLFCVARTTRAWFFPLLMGTAKKFWQVRRSGEKERKRPRLLYFILKADIFSWLCDPEKEYQHIS